jgi:hypothetical protein
MRVKGLGRYVMKRQENKEPCQVKLLKKDQATKRMTMKNLSSHCAESALLAFEQLVCLVKLLDQFLTLKTSTKKNSPGFKLPPCH